LLIFLPGLLIHSGYSFAHSFATLSQPAGRKMTFAVFESSCHLLLLV